MGGFCLFSEAVDTPSSPQQDDFRSHCFSNNEKDQRSHLNGQRAGHAPRFVPRVQFAVASVRLILKIKKMTFIMS